MYYFCCLLQIEIGDSIKKVQDAVVNACSTEAKDYSTLLLGIFVGAILFKLFDYLFAQSKVEKAYKMMLESKQELTEGYKLIISDRIDKVQVDEHSKPFMKRLRNHFKERVKTKRKK